MPQTYFATPATILSATVAAWSALLAVILSRIMATQVNRQWPNRQLPKADRISSPRHSRNLRKLYKQLYPRTKLVLLLDAAIIALILSLIVLVESLLFG